MPVSDPTVRRSIEDEIERLISLLDLVDSDPDLEPWLAGGIEVVGTADREMDSSELEADDCDFEEAGDQELSLGWSEPCSQGRDEWARNGYQYVAGIDCDAH